jgi:uncharacterized membrane protein YdbT with pleckstrin-like domain
MSDQTVLYACLNDATARLVRFSDTFYIIKSNLFVVVVAVVVVAVVVVAVVVVAVVVVAVVVVSAPLILKFREKKFEKNSFETSRGLLICCIYVSDNRTRRAVAS